MDAKAPDGARRAMPANSRGPVLRQVSRLRRRTDSARLPGRQTRDKVDTMKLSRCAESPEGLGPGSLTLTHDGASGSDSDAVGTTTRDFLPVCPEKVTVGSVSNRIASPAEDRRKRFAGRRGTCPVGTHDFQPTTHRRHAKWLQYDSPLLASKVKHHLPAVGKRVPCETNTGRGRSTHGSCCPVPSPIFCETATIFR